MSSSSPSPLYLAAIRGDVPGIKSLISEGTNLDEQDDFGQTALMVAASAGYAEIVELLIEGGANVNLRDSNDGTALIGASLRGHVEVVKALIRGGIDIDLKFGNGLGGLQYAAIGGHVKILELLLAQGAEIDDRDKTGFTALINACTGGHIEAVKFLLENGADPTAAGKQGDTALHIAAANGHHNLLAPLRNAGADVNARNIYGATPLFYAARKGHRETVDWLRAFGADVDIPVTNGETPLMVAALNHHTDVVKVLVSAGANVDAESSAGYTVVGALQESFEQIIEILKPTSQIKTLYRFIPYDRFKDLVLGRTLCLSQVANWDDTYEGNPIRHLLRNTLRENFPDIAERMLEALVTHYLNCMYAQSWTTLAESDALWRIYSPSKGADFIGIRISVNREKLIQTVTRNIPVLTHGRVVYCAPKEALIRIAKSASESHRTGVPLKVLLDKAFFYKRLDFNHEHEFRIGAFIFPSGPPLDIPPDDKNSALIDSAIARINRCIYQERYCFPFDPLLIEEVVLDPRASDIFLTEVRNLCSSIPGMMHTVVRKSDLYGPPS